MYQYSARSKTAIPGTWFVLVMLLVAFVPGLTASLAAEEEDLIADTWLMEDGLPANSITSILQTRDGYLWLGGPKGLTRFDGVRFVAVRPANASPLESHSILCLYEDRKAALWAGTEDAGLISCHRGQFDSITSRDGLSSGSVLCIKEDQTGDLWVGTSSGLNRLHEGHPTSYFKIDGLPDDHVNAILETRAGQLLFATPMGLGRFSAERIRKCEVAGLPPEKAACTLLYQDRADRLWLAARPGLCRLENSDAADGFILRQTLPQGVTSLIERMTGEVWFGTADGRLYRLEAGSGFQLPKRVRQFRSAITALCEDREGNLWVGTARDGLCRLKQRQFVWIPFPEELNRSQPPLVFETPDGILWLATQERELYRSGRAGFEFMGRLPLPAGAVLRTVCAAGQGDLWVGTLGEGLFHYKADLLTHFSQGDGLSDSAIESLWADKGESLWLGTRNGGLNRLEEGRITRFNTHWGFTGNFASVLVRDIHGILWIGTTGDGLFQLAEGSLRPFADNARLPSPHITTLHADEEGALWVGTAKGLCRIDRDRLTTLSDGSALSEATISDLQSDQQGHLWISTSHGIYRLSKSQMDAYGSGRSQNLDVISYGKADGLPDLQCLPTENNRIGHATRVWFATTRGVALVEPGRVRWNTLRPQVIIEQVLADNQSVLPIEPIRLSPGKESLRFHYTALSLTAPEKVRFRYQLEGLDQGWNDAGHTRVAQYPKVPPGAYTFRVVACNNDGIWSEAGATMAVVVTPFWWATGWFRAAVAMAAAALVIGLYWLRRERRRAIQRLRMRIASDLHDEVGSSLWSIALLSQTMEKPENLPLQNRRTAGEVRRIALQTSNSIRDIVWLINPAFDTMQDLVLRMKDFAETALSGMECQWDHNEANLQGKLSFEVRQNLLLFFKVALTNISKHAGATRVEVRIEERDDLWRLVISDNGIGFDPSRATKGNGIRNLHTRARTIGARVKVQSQPGSGTTIILTAPPHRIRGRRFKIHLPL